VCVVEVLIRYGQYKHGMVWYGMEWTMRVIFSSRLMSMSRGVSDYGIISLLL